MLLIRSPIVRFFAAGGGLSEQRLEGIMEAIATVDNFGWAGGGNWWCSWTTPVVKSKSLWVGRQSWGCSESEEEDESGLIRILNIESVGELDEDEEEGVLAAK